MNRSCRRPLVVAAILCAWLVPEAAVASLRGPSVRGLAVSASEVAVQVGPRVLSFDHEGTFRREVANPPAGGRLLALTDDGRLWFAVAGTDDGTDGPSAVAVTDDAGATLSRHPLTPGSTAYVSPSGKAFAGRLQAGRLRIERLSAEGRSPHAEIPIESARRDDETVSWAVHDDGDVFVLFRESERGRVVRFRPEGPSVRTWPVAPDPVTSVSYMKDVLLGADGVPYATHGSWEVSSSTSNSGSVLRLDPSGGEPFRIKAGIGYLQLVAVTASGDVFVSELSDEITRFSSTGERTGAWIVVPPRFGESWQERGSRIAASGRIGADSTVRELALAIVYGGDEAVRKARGLLQARGVAAVPEATSAVLRFPGEYHLAAAAEALWTAHPDEAARLFQSTKEEPVRRLLAPFLAYRAPLVPGVRDTLGRMVLEGDERAQYALDHVGPTPEVVLARIAAFRRALRSKESTFQAAYSLQVTYAASITALEPLLLDASDPDRAAVRDLMLEGSVRLASPDEAGGKVQPIPVGVLDRTRAWSRHADPLVRETAAIALTSLGVTGQEAAALAAAGRTPALVVPTLRAFALLAREHGDAVTPHVEALSRLSRNARAKGSTDDALEALARIPHGGVIQRCLKLLTDETLGAERRGAILLGLDTAAIPRPSLLAVLREQGWQRSLAREYFYYSFLEDVSKIYVDDPDIRAEVKAALFGIVSDPQLARVRSAEEEGESPRAQALTGLAALAEPADLPRLAPLLGDPQLDAEARAGLLRVLSQLTPDAAVCERLRPMLRDPELALSVAQSLGRAGDHAALDVLVEQGLKKLGFYSHVSLDVGSFRPLGADAEEALLGLLDYPNEGTQEAVRRFLVEWPSAEGRRRIRAELDDAVAAGRAPRTDTLGAVALGGEDVTEPLLRLASERPDAVDELRPEHTAGPLTKQLRDALARESDPARRRALEKLSARLCACEDE
jgi:hypothetical protein